MGHKLLLVRGHGQMPVRVVREADPLSPVLLRYRFRFNVEIMADLVLQIVFTRLQDSWISRFDNKNEIHAETFRENVS